MLALSGLPGEYPTLPLLSIYSLYRSSSSLHSHSAFRSITSTIHSKHQSFVQCSGFKKRTMKCVLWEFDSAHSRMPQKLLCQSLRGHETGLNFCPGFLVLFLYRRAFLEQHVLLYSAKQTCRHSGCNTMHT